MQTLGAPQPQVLVFSSKSVKEKCEKVRSTIIRGSNHHQELRSTSTDESHRFRETGGASKSFKFFSFSVAIVIHTGSDESGSMCLDVKSPKCQLAI